MATTQARDKYYLRSLHEEIALFDRKLAHLLKFDTFASGKERDTAAGKLSTKREQLVRTARQLAEEGVEFKPAELPHSLRAGEPHAADLISATHPVDAVAPPAAPQDQPAVASYDGTVLNFRNEIQEYMQKRRKQYVPANQA